MGLDAEKRGLAAEGDVVVDYDTIARALGSQHARLNGETVPVGERFSNGADWTGDSFSLPVSEVANCHCDVVVKLPD